MGWCPLSDPSITSFESDSISYPWAAVRPHDGWQVIYVCVVPSSWIQKCADYLHLSYIARKIRMVVNWCRTKNIERFDYAPQISIACAVYRGPKEDKYFCEIISCSLNIEYLWYISYILKIKVMALSNFCGVPISRRSVRGYSVGGEVVFKSEVRTFFLLQLALSCSANCRACVGIGHYCRELPHAPKMLISLP
jgi:hypothetical protein